MVIVQYTTLYCSALHYSLLSIYHSYGFPAVCTYMRAKNPDSSCRSTEHGSLIKVGKSRVQVYNNNPKEYLRLMYRMYMYVHTLGMTSDRSHSGRVRSDFAEANF